MPLPRAWLIVRPREWVACSPCMHPRRCAAIVGCRAGRRPARVNCPSRSHRLSGTCAACAAPMLAMLACGEGWGAAHEDGWFCQGQAGSARHRRKVGPPRSRPGVCDCLHADLAVPRSCPSLAHTARQARQLSSLQGCRRCPRHDAHGQLLLLLLEPFPRGLCLCPRGGPDHPNACNRNGLVNARSNRRAAELWGAPQTHEQSWAPFLRRAVSVTA